MENMEQDEDDSMVDFESGIFTWVIDKDESVGSLLSLDQTEKEEIKDKNMNKENIKQSAHSSDKKSLRTFRIRKRVSYQELSSESESDSKKKGDDRNDSLFLSKRKRSNPSNISKFKRTFSSSSSHCHSNEKKRDLENLSSEEICIMLSEIDDSSRDSFCGGNREKLHSIENVSCLIDNKHGDSLSSSINKLNFKCNLCNCEFHNAEELKSHEETHQNTIKYDYLFKTSHSNDSDMLSPVINSKPASVNNKTSVLKIKQAKPIVSKTNSLECGICGYRSAELLIYKSHQILFHNDKTNLECEYCDYKTTLCANLATHIRVHFQMDCPFCDYHCSLRSSLDAHLMMNHQNADPYKCEKCSYSCKSQNKFYKHLRIHGMKKYQCTECKKSFSSKHILKLHIKKHIMSKNVYVCSKCKLRFSQKHSLKLHIKCHEKPNRTYVCSTCNSSFKQKNHLMNHSKSHTKILTRVQKPFKCEKCDSAFTQTNHLNLHMRSHFPKYTKCKHCSFRCTDLREILNHICVPVNKLYHVQKRSLNFEGVGKKVETTVMESESFINEETPTNEIGSKPKPEVKKSFIEEETPTNEMGSTPKPEVKKRGRKPKPKALQSNVSHKSQLSIEINNGKKNGQQQYTPGTSGRQLLRRKIRTNLNNSQYLKKNNAHKTNSKMKNCISVNKVGAIRRQKKSVRKVRKERLRKGLECVKLLFEKRKTLEEMLLEPVRFENNRYIECYYQSQQPSSATGLTDHQEQHLRRNSLLSCRYCNYKTNSQQLLKTHNDKNHTWDAAVVSKLFR